jgi:hypothetical protein
MRALSVLTSDGWPLIRRQRVEQVTADVKLGWHQLMMVHKPVCGESRGL